MKTKVTALSTATAIGAAFTPASAVVISYELDAPLSVTAGSGLHLFFNLTDQWAALDADMPDFQFRLSFGATYPDSIPTGAKPLISGVGGLTDIAVGTEPAKAYHFSHGDVIPGNEALTYSTDTHLNHNGNTHGWPSDTRGYLGLRMNDAEVGATYGWADVEYGADQSLTLYSFAYDDSGAAIQAGATAVPEPATSAFLAALAAGSVAMYSRRRQQARADA